MAQAASSVISYPAQYESDVVLRDGSTLRLRPIRSGDAEALQALHDRLSQQSQRFRFFGLATSRAGEVSRLLRADHDNEFVLVAEAGNRLVGVATYVRDSTEAERAEVGFAIADALQGRGVGTRMLEMLAGIARDHHITMFDADVMVDNDRMMRVFTDTGFEVQRRLEGGIFHVELSLAPDEYSGFVMTLLRLHAFRPSSVADFVAAVTPRAKSSAQAVAKPPETPPVQPKPPAISASPVPIPASQDADWHQIVSALPLSGLARTLAQHCELRLISETECCLRLAPAHAHLQMKPSPERLQQALGDYFGRPLRLKIELGNNETDTPAVAAGRERQERQERAIAAIEQDGFVRDVIESFDASLVESSIKPIA